MNEETIRKTTTYSYYGWKVNTSEKLAKLNSNTKAFNHIELPLFSDESCFLLQGWWPSAPVETPTNVVSGICLFDGRWQVEFERRSKLGQPARRRISLKHERADAFKRMYSGQRVQNIYVPVTLGEYHNKLLDWQFQYLKQWKPKKLIYHIPEDDYHNYIKCIEDAIGRKLPELHTQLKSFTELVKSEIIRRFESLSISIRFVYPTREWNAPNGMNPSVLLYLHISEWSDDVHRTVALIDLVESYPVRVADSISGFKIPTLGVVLGVPHPYSHNRRSLVDCKVLSLEFHKNLQLIR